VDVAGFRSLAFSAKQCTANPVFAESLPNFRTISFAYAKPVSSMGKTKKGVISILEIIIAVLDTLYTSKLQYGIAKYRSSVAASSASCLTA